MKFLRTSLLALSLAACACSLPAQTPSGVAPSPAPALAITHLTGDLYVYTTYGQSGGAPYPANSMYLLTSKGAVMFDTPWDSTQYQPLNIVIWLMKDKVLYGGCFVKSTEAPDLGNLADADPAAWPASIRRVRKEFPDPAFVIPGHLDWTNRQSLLHTEKLLQQYKESHP